MNINKNTLIVFGVLALVLAGYFFFRDRHVDVPAPKNFVVIAFGDSLVQGVGATEGNDFVSLVSRAVGIPIVNEGRSGDTTSSALGRIDAVIARNPGTVILLLGGNDYLRKIPKETTFQNLKTIVDRFKKNDTRVILLGVRGGLLRDTYEKDFAAFAQREELPHVSNVLEGLIGNREYMSDEIHPNDKGYRVIAERVIPVVKNVLRK